MIHVGYSDLGKAFHAHFQAYKKTQGSCSSYLLLFYAVECGLKSIWLRENSKISNTSKLQNEEDKKLFTTDGHNLAEWIKVLNFSARELKEIGIGAKLNEVKYFRLHDHSSRNVEEAHQAWRYNVRINKDDEDCLVNCLENLCNLIKDRINR